MRVNLRSGLAVLLLLTTPIFASNNFANLFLFEGTEFSGFSDFHLGSPTSGNETHDGTLSPGTYSILVGSYTGYDWDFSSYDAQTAIFSFSLSQDPVSSSFSLHGNANARQQFNGQQVGETVSYSETIPTARRSAFASQGGVSSAAALVVQQLDWASNGFSATHLLQARTSGHGRTLGGGTIYTSASGNLSTQWTFTLNEATDYHLEFDTSRWIEPGETPYFPILPRRIDDEDGFNIIGTRGRWVDPPTASGYRFTMNGTSLFTKILDFPTGFDEPFDVYVNDALIGSFGPGDEVDFAALFPAAGGVSSFVIDGIVPGVDPTSPVAFPIQLDYSTQTADFNMTPIPEPAGAAVLVAVCSLLGLRRRHV